MIARPGSPEIRPHRLPRRRTLLVLATLATVGALAAPATPALTQDELAAEPSTSPAGATSAISPVDRTAGPNQYGPPVWVPLRRGLDGGEVTVGCTYDSHGSEHGYECGGHHGRWAIDFIAETGTPVFAAGAGFATDITGKPGGSGFGNVVRVDHGFGASTVYAHLDEAMVPAEGTWVDESTQIGTVGSTGSSSTPHLHYERFVLPSGATSVGQEESVDPGPLFACRAGFLVAYPEVAGFDSWQGLPWGSHTVANDGPDCLDDAEGPAGEGDDGAFSTLIAPVLRILGHSDGWHRPAVD